MALKSNIDIDKLLKNYYTNYKESIINAALNILSKYVTSQSIVGWELTEITNACGVPRSTVKQENELTSPEKV